MSDPLSNLLQTQSAKVELECLQKIYSQLKISLNCESQDDIPPEEIAFISDNVDPSVFCNSQQQLNLFTCYIFDRRFGWSEANTDSSRRVRRMSSTGTVFESSDGHQKAIIIEILDFFMKWYLHQKLTGSLSEAFQYTLKQVERMPVVRNRTVVHIMEWLKENRDNLKECESTHLILDLIRSSLTDVWSAIRSACAKHLGHVVCYFTIADQEALFNSLTKICKCESSLWQAKEGAIMGINAIIQQYHENMTSRSQTPTFTLDTELQTNHHSVPSFISTQIHWVVFSLLSHPQLTIRENSAKALSTYIACSDAKEALSTFEQAIALLCKGVTGISAMSTAVKLPVKFLDAYAAEGILNVCLVLVKVLSLSQLLPRWGHYMSAFVLYLSHPASTVRQAASNIFKSLVSKGSHCAVLIKLVLQVLTDGWEPDIEALKKEETIFNNSGVTHDNRPSVSEAQVGDILSTWESREGRLFAYELIFKFLIKNHWLYTFGPAGVGVNSDFYSDSQNEDKQTEECAPFEANLRRDRRRSEALVPPLLCVGRPVIHTSGSDMSFAQARRRSWRQVKFSTQDVSDKDTRPMNGDNIPVTSHKYIQKENAPSRMDTIYSILMQIKAIENKDPLNNNETSCQRQLKYLEVFIRSLDECCNSDKENVKKWLQTLQLEDLSKYLVKVLHQTLECLADSRWELKRMAQQGAHFGATRQIHIASPCQVPRLGDVIYGLALSKQYGITDRFAYRSDAEIAQVLPCLAEVMRWFDMTILQDIWRRYLSPKTSLFTYAAALLLKESVAHTVKLQPLLHKHPVSWQDHDICRKVIHNIVSSLSSELESCLSCLNKLLQRPTYDRLSIIAVSTIIIAHNNFSILDDQKLSQTATVLSFWKLLFCFTHPMSRISQDLLCGSTDIRLFSSPLDGYLSCSLVRPENKLQCAKQVEKFLVTEIFFVMKPFIQNLPAASSCLVIPIIAHYVGLFVEDTHVCKALCECLSVVGAKVVDFTNSVADDHQRRTCLKCINFTLKELSAIITMKSTEVYLVQKVLTIYNILCKALNPQKHLRLILVAICSRISEDIFFSVEHSPRPGDDLTLLSNDIPLSSSPDCTLQWDNDEAAAIIGSPGEFPECLTLDLSANSGSMASGRLSALSQHSDKSRSKSPVHGDNDNDLDAWDSWDEEEDEGHAALKEVFCEFLEKLRSACSKGSKDLFSSEMSKLDTRERNLILEIMDD